MVDTDRFLAANLLHPQTQMHYHYITQIDSVTQAHDHDFCELFLVGYGQVIHRVGEHTQVLREGTLVLIRARDRHCFQAADGDACGILNLAFPTRWLRQVLACLWEDVEACPLWGAELPPQRLLNVAQTKAWIQKMEGINLFSFDDAQGLQRYARQLLLEAIAAHFAEEPPRAKTRVPQWLAEAREKMRQPEALRVGLPALRTLCGKTPEHLNRQFRRYYQQTPAEYVQELRVNYAANLLAHTDQPIQAIADFAGFAHIGYFYQQFKRRFGLTPAQFRRETKTSAIIAEGAAD